MAPRAALPCCGRGEHRLRVCLLCRLRARRCAAVDRCRRLHGARLPVQLHGLRETRLPQHLPPAVAALPALLHQPRRAELRAAATANPGGIGRAAGPGSVTAGAGPMRLSRTVRVRLSRTERAGCTMKLATNQATAVEEFKPIPIRREARALGRTRFAFRMSLDLQLLTCTRFLSPHFAGMHGAALDVGCGEMPFRGLLPAGTNYTGPDIPQAAGFGMRGHP